MACRVWLMTSESREFKIAAIRQQLHALDQERQRLAARLKELQRTLAEQPRAPAAKRAVTNSSPAAGKIALFRRRFAGRTDAFPVRWENPKTGRLGRAPACANEWVRGVCGKPQIRCGECPSQAFIPMTSDVIECHLRGEDRVRPNGRGGDFVAGVYPLFFDDTCSFLAVDFDGENWTSDALSFVTTCRSSMRQPRSRDRAQATAATCGFSFPSLLRHRRPVASGLCC